MDDIALKDARDVLVRGLHFCRTKYWEQNMQEVIR